MVYPDEVPAALVSDLPTSNLSVLDVREDYEWVAGHAPGALHIPLSELPMRVAELAEFPDHQPVYVVCRSGIRSASAAAWLNASGWDAVNVAGGMKSWRSEGRPLVAEQGAEPEIV